MRFNTNLSLLLILLAAPFSVTLAQDLENPDDLFAEARIAAFEQEDYTTAIRLAIRALEIAPGYLDIKEFLGRVYLWNNQRTLAKNTLTQVLEQDPSRSLSRGTLADIYIEEGDYGAAITLLTEGLKNAPTNVDFLFKKGLALELTDKPELAIGYYRRVEELQPSHPFVGDRISNLEVNQLSWEAISSITYSSFDSDLDPWITGEAGVVRKNSFGAVGLNVRYGSQFSTTDQEVELFAYPVISDKSYSYANVAFSSNNFFPKYRFAGSFFYTFPRRFEGEIGFRRLSFENDDVNIVTASLFKFTTKYRLAIRNYVTLDKSANYTGILLAGRYFGSIENFVELRAGYGSAAGNFNSVGDINRLNSFEASVQFQKEISHRFQAFAEAGYFKEEFGAGIERRRYQSRLGCSIKF